MLGRQATGAVLLLLLLVAAARGREWQRPNFIYMMADDHTSQAWGCYHSYLERYCPTPNIDRLASAGIRLTNCFCTNSICVPSRAAILTGQYSHVNGVKTLRHALDPSADNVAKRYVAKRLQRAGYQTAIIGKWHLKKPPAGFNYWNIIKGQGRYFQPKMYEMSFDRPPHIEADSYCSDLFTDTALTWLRRRCRDRPFRLMLHFKATPEPWNFDRRFASLYRNVQLPEPPTLRGQTGPIGTRVPRWPLEIVTQRMVKGGHGDGKMALTSSDPREIRSQTYQKFIKAYLRCVAGIDNPECAPIIARLKQELKRLRSVVGDTR